MPRAVRSLLGLALAIAAILPEGAVAQARLTLDLRAGGSIPVGSFKTGPLSGGSIEAAPAFGLHFALRQSRWLDVYAGFSQLRFGCKADGCVDPGELVSTAWDLGVHVRPVAGPWGPWFRAGVVIAGIEANLPTGPGGAPGSGDGVPRTSGTSLGGEVGVGWRIRLANAVGLSPGIRYTRVDSRLDGDLRFDMRYWVADIGLVLGF